MRSMLVPRPYLNRKSSIAVILDGLFGIACERSGMGASVAQLTNFGAIFIYSTPSINLRCNNGFNLESPERAAVSASGSEAKLLAIIAAPFSPIPRTPGKPSEASPLIIANKAYLSPGISYLLAIQT